MANRNHTIDFFKGILIIFVVIGHVVSEPIPLRYVIYSFHMPVFLFIAGYLMKIDNHIQRLKRFIIPFTVASIFYYSAWNFGLFKDGLFGTNHSLLYYFLFPQFHLWFLYALIIHYGIILVTQKFNLWKLIFAIAIILCLIKVKFLETRFIDIKHGLGYLVFTLTGYMFKQKKLSFNKFYPAVFIILFTVRIYRDSHSQFYPLIDRYDMISMGMFCLMNIFLGLSIGKLIENYSGIKIAVINYIGRNSLPVYLLHVFTYEALRIKFSSKPAIIVLSIILPLMVNEFYQKIVRAKIDIADVSA